MKIVKLYYADWCGHCQRFKPEWEKIKKTLESKGIKYEEYESGKDEEKIKEAKIKGFPTIKIQDGKEEREYEGRREHDALINEVMKQRGGEKKEEEYYKKKYYKYKTKYTNLKKMNEERNKL